MNCLQTLRADSLLEHTSAIYYQGPTKVIIINISRWMGGFVLYVLIIRTVHVQGLPVCSALFASHLSPQTRMTFHNVLPFTVGFMMHDNKSTGTIHNLIKLFPSGDMGGTRETLMHFLWGTTTLHGR